MELFIIIVSMVAGGFLLHELRDDTLEEIFGLHFGRVLWTASLFAWGVAICLATRPFNFELWRCVIGNLFLVALIWNVGHGPMLRPHTQDVRASDFWRDPIRGLLNMAFDKKVGDIMGLPYWLTYSSLRYALPLIGLGFFMGGPSVLGVPALAFSGPLVVLAYQPVGYTIALKLGWNTSFLSAALAGGAVYGLMSVY